MIPANRRKLLTTLRRLYPNPQSELNFRSNYELIVAVVLSAQCTDKKVNEVTPTLFRTYPSFAALAAGRQAEIAAIIRPVNYYRTKAKHLLELARLVTTKHQGRLPRTLAELQELPGVGRKTASVVLVETGLGPAFPVDTHVLRVAQRLGLARGTKPQQVENEICADFAVRHWRNLHHWLIFHGRRVCKSQRPLCSQCALAPVCPSRRDPPAADRRRASAAS